MVSSQFGSAAVIQRLWVDKGVNGRRAPHPPAPEKYVEGPVHVVFPDLPHHVHSAAQRHQSIFTEGPYHHHHTHTQTRGVGRRGDDKILARVEPLSLLAHTIVSERPLIVTEGGDLVP